MCVIEVIGYRIEEQAFKKIIKGYLYTKICLVVYILTKIWFDECNN